MAHVDGCVFPAPPPGPISCVHRVASPMQDGLAVTPDGMEQGHSKLLAVCCAGAGSVRLEVNKDNSSRPALLEVGEGLNHPRLLVEMGAV